jgi:hypothetical protein
MTDWTAAGRKAWETRQLNDAHRVRDLYRAAFGGIPKSAARGRAIDVLKRAGGTVVLDLWGGGLSALELMAAGFRVIAVDDGSMPLVDGDGRSVSNVRKMRALRVTAEEGGYEWRWGKAAKFMAEADCALLDFCGPLSSEVYRTIEAVRHMKAAIVTLMTDHDIVTGAVNQSVRRVMYEAALRLATMETSRKTHGGLWRNTGWKSTRLLCTYRRAGRQPVWLFLLAPHRIKTGATPVALIDADAYEHSKARTRDRNRMRRQTDSEYAARHNARSLAYYHRMKADPDWLADRNAKRREKRKEARTLREHHSGLLSAT